MECYPEVYLFEHMTSSGPILVLKWLHLIQN